MQHRVSFEVSQPQCFKNKYYLIAHTLKMAAAWLSSASPAVSLVSTDGETPAEVCGAWSPLLPHQSLEPGCFVCSHSPSAGWQGGSVRAVSAPPPGAREDQGAVCQ